LHILFDIFGADVAAGKADSFEFCPFPINMPEYREIKNVYMIRLFHWLWFHVQK